MEETWTMELERLCGGAVVNQFREAVHEVGANIRDENTDADKAREITVKVKFRPDKNRHQVDVEAQISLKLAAKSALRTVAYVGAKGTIVETVPPEQTMLEIVEALSRQSHPGATSEVVAKNSAHAAQEASE